MAKLEKVNYYPNPGSYPSKGNAFVNDQRVRYDEHGYDLNIVITGRSHAIEYSKAGRFDGCKWEFVVSKDSTARVWGVHIHLKINSYISSDATPPDLAYSEITFDLDTKGFGRLFNLKKTSNTDGSGAIPPVDREWKLTPLREKPRMVSLTMDLACHVVLDRAKSTRADQDTQILMSLVPYFDD